MLEDQFGILSALEEREVSYTNKVGNQRARIVRRFEGYLKEYEVKESGTDVRGKVILQPQGKEFFT